MGLLVNLVSEALAGGPLPIAPIMLLAVLAAAGSL